MNKFLARLAIPVLDLPRAVKRVVALAADMCLSVLAVWLAFYLRLGEFMGLTGSHLWAVLVSLCLAFPIFITSGFYRAIFRYSGVSAMVTVARALGLYGVLYAAVFTVYGIPGVPRTIGLIQPLLMLLLIGASRALARFWLGGMYMNQLKRQALPQVLIYGAGAAGRQLATAMANNHEMRMVGFLDDDTRLQGHVLNGLPIYNPAHLPQLLGQFPITDVLLALPSVSRQRRNAILASLAPLRVAVRTLPGVTDLAAGRVNLSDLRELDIDDLLGREPVQPDSVLLNLNTHGKTVLVTGAGGSIGSELCRQILRCGPTQLLLVDMSEFALYQIHQELRAALQGTRTLVQPDAEEEPMEDRMDVEIVPLLASVCDEVRMQEIMATWTPQTVYHAAAYKHVPLVEHNPAEGVRNNVWGTMVCAQAAARNGVQNFVLISTDKAVRPTNIMGASKRLAEMVLQALAAIGTDSPTVFSMVRFGNVLGSSGSVVPLFREQIKNGGPITLTDADITRYFMTIPEAAQLVIQAGAMGRGGDVFILDMGQPVRIYDLARRMVELSGLSLRSDANPGGDIEITITGLRPGEKLYEELLIGNDPKPTQHARIMKATEEFLPWAVLMQNLADLNAANRSNDVPAIRNLLHFLVSGYQPNDDVVDWVHIARSRQHP